MNKQSERITLSDEIKNNICKTFNNKCVNCQTTLKTKFEIYHIVPLSAGENNEVDNLQLLCCSCQKEKSKYDQEDGDYVRIIETESSYNSEVRNIMKSSLAYSYAFIECMTHNNKSGKNVLTIT